MHAAWLADQIIISGANFPRYQGWSILRTPVCLHEPMHDITFLTLGKYLELWTSLIISDDQGAKWRPMPYVRGRGAVEPYYLGRLVLLSVIRPGNYVGWQAILQAWSRQRGVKLLSACHSHLPRLFVRMRVSPNRRKRRF